MIRQNRGWIVNIASRAGYGHSAGAALYSASKAGALALFDSLADEVKPYAINVNSVVPSIFDTPANRRAMPSADPALWPKPAQIAQVILFLCSPESSVIHGAAIPVYGRT
jgi:NAD(P)-dependent dehydrogenase (short-subunit alcohol dehydrogenase family)